MAGRPAPRSRRSHALAALLAVLLAACGGGDGGTDTSVFRIRPGDCFNDPEPGRQLDQVDVTPCDQPHDNEVFGVVEHPAADIPFPGHDAIVAHAEQACPAPFADYVGMAYDQSRFSLFPIVPSAETWTQGDRQIICALYDNEAGKLTGSVRGSAR
jgi:hypothetical protein